MDINQYAKQSRLPLKILRWMVAEKMIHDPLQEEDQPGLKLLEKVWWRKEILRAQLIKFSKKGRLKLIETADLKTKWERYAFARFQNLADGEKIQMKQLVDEIEMTFNFTLNRWQIKQLYRVRQKVYDLRRRRKTSGKSTNK